MACLCPAPHPLTPSPLPLVAAPAWTTARRDGTLPSRPFCMRSGRKSRWCAAVAAASTTTPAAHHIPSHCAGAGVDGRLERGCREQGRSRPARKRAGHAHAHPAPAPWSPLTDRPPRLAPNQLDKSAGFTLAERNSFRDFLQRGWVDTFRRQHPDLHQFSYWGFRGNNREKNKGAPCAPAPLFP